jgi:hypothetical protein
MAENYEVQAQAPRQMSAGATIMESKAMQEARTEIQMAKMFPRDMAEVEVAMTQEFQNYSLAEKAMYAYPRGGQTVSGLSIRSAEALARAYGNMSYGFKILEQDEDQTTVLAVAWDKQRNVKVEREMRIAHVIQTKQGPKRKDDPRDRLEHITSWAQRGVRSVVLELIPKGLQERAQETIAATVKKGPRDVPLHERINRMVTAFTGIGVPKEYLEKRMGHKAAAATPDELVEYIGIYNSILNKQATVNDFFGQDEAPAATMTQNVQASSAALDEINKICNELTKGMNMVQKASFMEDTVGVSKLDDLKKMPPAFLDKVLSELRARNQPPQVPPPIEEKESEEDIINRLKGQK